MKITNEAKRQLYAVLEKLKSKSDLAPEPSAIQKQAIKSLEEDDLSGGGGIIASSRQQQIEKNFTYYLHKKIRLYYKDSADCGVEFSHELKNILATMRTQGAIVDFRYITAKSGKDYYEVPLADNFDEAYQKFEILFRPEDRAGHILPPYNRGKFDKEPLAPDVAVGKLIAYNDGSIRYGEEMIKLPNQQKDLCRLFMHKVSRLVTIDRIRDELIRADRRNTIKYNTIAKYVSKLRKILERYYKTNVIFNQAEEGWYFKPPA
jgi:hypothetical protein